MQCRQVDRIYTAYYTLILSLSLLLWLRHTVRNRSIIFRVSTRQWGSIVKLWQPLGPILQAEAFDAAHGVLHLQTAAAAFQPYLAFLVQHSPASRITRCSPRAPVYSIHLCYCYRSIFWKSPTRRTTRFGCFDYYSSNYFFFLCSPMRITG